MVTVELPSPPQAEVTRNGDLWPCRWPKHRQHAGHGDAPPDGPSVQTGRVEGGDSRAICRDLPGQGGGVLGQPDRACRRHMARWRDERAAPRTVKAALTVLAAVALWRHVVPVPGAALLARSAEQQRSSPMASLILSPQRYDAVIFDLDGVVTDTASVHAAAWRRLSTTSCAPGPARQVRTTGCSPTRTISPMWTDAPGSTGSAHCCIPGASTCRPATRTTRRTAHPARSRQPQGRLLPANAGHRRGTGVSRHRGPDPSAAAP